MSRHFWQTWASAHRSYDEKYKKKRLRKRSSWSNCSIVDIWGSGGAAAIILILCKFGPWWLTLLLPLWCWWCEILRIVCGVLDCDLLFINPFPLFDILLVELPDIREGFSGALPTLTDWVGLLLLDPPQSTFVTRSITLVFSPDLLFPLLWWCFERNPRPLIRFESSAEARSTTPWADIEDIFNIQAQHKSHYHTGIPWFLTPNKILNPIFDEYYQHSLILVTTANASTLSLIIFFLRHFFLHFYAILCWRLWKNLCNHLHAKHSRPDFIANLCCTKHRSIVIKQCLFATIFFINSQPSKNHVQIFFFLRSARKSLQQKTAAFSLLVNKQLHGFD